MRKLLLVTSKRMIIVLLNKVILLLVNELVMIDIVGGILHHSVLVFVRFSEFIGLVLSGEDLSLLDVLRHSQEIV